MNRATPPKESYGYVFRKNTWLIVLLSVLLAGLVGLSVFITEYNRTKDTLYLGFEPVDIGRKPSEILSDTTDGELGSVLTETTPVDESYFADAMFIGDSFTQGVEIFKKFGGVTTVWKVGINSHSAMTETFYKPTPDSEKLLTMVEAVEYHNPRKLYIMLGTNGIDWESLEWNIEGYSVLIDELALRVPGCYIIIQSIPPTTRETSAARPRLSRENIDKYNALLLDLAMNKGVYFLDVNASLRDEEGYMPDDIAAYDGIHMIPDGYSIWYEYVITHAIKGEAAYTIGDDGRIIYVDPGEDENEDITPPDDSPPDDEA